MQSKEKQVEKSQYCPLNTYTGALEEQSTCSGLLFFFFYARSFDRCSSDRDDYWTIKVIKLPAAKKRNEVFCRFLAMLSKRRQKKKIK